MATWDSADLLARCVALADRPTSDQSIVTARWYQLLSEAQDYWTAEFAIHCPSAILTAPTLMTSADGGKTYTFSGSIQPLAVIVYTALDGVFLRPGSYDDPNADYVWEGTLIRMTRGQSRTFAAGPYARYVTPSTVMDGSTAPTLTPARARILMVYHAVAEWARQGGKRDPSPFEDKMMKLAWGNPVGIGGIVGGLKIANPFLGMMAYAQSGVTGYAYVAQKTGYTAYPI